MFRTALLAFLVLLAVPGEAAPLLHPLFQDNAVLQRDAPIPVYGTAAPGAALTVALGSSKVEGRADGSGHWQVMLPKRAAGGPYTLTVTSSSGETQTAANILIGDVWLCSGQSNMQLAVRDTADAAFEIAHATDPNIRLMIVAMHESLTPLETFHDPVSWQAESPANAGEFSATCLYFAHALRRSVKIPLGLIDDSWGGSRAQNWISEPALRQMNGYGDDLDILDTYRSDPAQAQARWAAKMEAWWRAHPLPGQSGDPWAEDFDASQWQLAPQNLGAWALWNGSVPDGHLGHMWFRTSVPLDAAQARQAAVLDLGYVRSEDQTWVNGKAVGATAGAPRALRDLPAGVLHEGDNVIVSNVFCGWRDCGLGGAPQDRFLRLADGSAVALNGPWRTAEIPEDTIAPSLPWAPTRGLAMDYNGMIAPLGAYGLRGVVWYQGESDSYYAEGYRAALTGLMADWRRQFARNIPFLIVQLPNYGKQPVTPTASGWASVRQAQRQAVAQDNNAALTVTIDLGDRDNVHPIKKREVGRRLALAARRLVYGEASVLAGPVAASVARQGRDIAVVFQDVSGALASFSGAPTAFELCGETQASCTFVPARIVGNNVLLPNAKSARRVRYCWGDSPVCTLTDATRIPAGPFELSLAP